MGKHLVIVGGGHAHLLTLTHLHHIQERGHRVTVIAPADHHYYSGMGPGMLSKTYTPQEIRFNTRQMVECRGGRFIRAQVVKIDPQTQTLFVDRGPSHEYDVLSLNSGSGVPQLPVTGGTDGVYGVKPIANLLKLQSRMLTLGNARVAAVGVVGGGPAALEIAGNLWRLNRDHARFMPQITLFTGKAFMGHFPSKVRRQARNSLTQRGVRIIENDYVQAIDQGQIVLANGTVYPVDIVCLAHGVKPAPIFTANDLPLGPDGGLMVNRYLQSIAYANILGGGDCIYFKPQPLNKVGVYAVRQNPVLYHNIVATLEGLRLKAFDPGGNYLLAFNLGNQRGIVSKNGLSFQGRPAFWIKDFIDKRFMNRFKHQLPPDADSGNRLSRKAVD